MPSQLEPRIRQWGMWCHLSILPAILVGLLLPIPFISILLPYIVWQNGRGKHPFINEQGREAVNFQISMTLYSLIGAVLFLVTLFQAYSLRTSNNQLFILILEIEMGLLAAFLLAQIIAVAIAAHKAYQGKVFRYPLIFRWLK